MKRSRAITMMHITATTALAGQRTNKWDGDDALMTMMIFLMTMKTTSNKKYDKKGWI